MRILFIAKRGESSVDAAISFCRERGAEVDVFLHDWGESIPEACLRWTGDLIVCYLARWILPASLLDAASLAAINFHPASPEYPGVGCNNMALYDEVDEFGVTCHHMAAKVDSGPIVAVRRFPVAENDTVASLLERTYAELAVLFRGVMAPVLAGEGLPASSETWGDRLFTRRDLQELERITPDMETDEIRRRVRATTFGSWRPYVELGGFRFEVVDPD
ncbi:MAG: hypothetical protein JJ896_15420 [Rhodothermales bacterium]|nr:hypothetical protein [Rhodothermales bacterium]MBO6781044.1 hypothetical protein [Rhodothermales bacterium]